MKTLISILALMAALVFATGRAWQAWGPVPERALPAWAAVAQWDNRTCGPAAVATLLNLYNRPWSRVELEQECRVGPRGASMYDLREACRRHGLWAEGMRATSPRGLLRVARPYIAYLSEPGEQPVPKAPHGSRSAAPTLVRSRLCRDLMGAGHFVVVKAWSKGRLVIFDPTFGRIRAWTPETLYQQGGGWLLAVHPHLLADWKDPS